MMLAKTFFTVALAIVVTMTTGCASIQHNYTPDVIKHDFPALNTETTVYVGESMLIQGEVVKHDVLKVNAPVDGACYDIPAGIYPKVGSDAKKQYFSIIGDKVQPTRAGICDPISGMYTPNDNPNKVCIVTVFGGTSCFETQAEIKKVAIVSSEHIQRSLMFSGKNNNEVEFLYTERAGIQTVHSHNVKYDLTKSDIIGYRGARIKIISCTNESITYTVIQNFPDRNN